MKRKTADYADLIEMAKEYNVENNAMFLAAAEQYSVQRRVIKTIKEALDEADDLTTAKSYIKGNENLYANPLVKELPKHTDSANRTLGLMLEIILKIGTKDAKRTNPLAAMRDE